jgi:hypothetical protein
VGDALVGTAENIFNDITLDIIDKVFVERIDMRCGAGILLRFKTVYGFDVDYSPKSVKHGTDWGIEMNASSLVFRDYGADPANSVVLRV